MMIRFRVFASLILGGGLFIAVLMILFGPYGPNIVCCGFDGDQADSKRPAIAIHHFRAYPGRGQEEARGDRAGLISSLLVNALGMSDRVSLLDRTQLQDLFSEMALRRGETPPGERTPLLPKLPISDYIVTGSLYPDEKGDWIAVRLVSSRNGLVVGMAHWQWHEETSAKVVAAVSDWIVDQVRQDRRKAGAVAEGERRLAFAGFECLNEDIYCTHHAARISDRLTEHYQNNERYPLVARTQVIPLVIEDILRNSQYMDKVAKIKDRDARYLVYGKLRGGGYGLKRKSLYLYIDDVNLGRRLEVINARDWNALYRKAEEAVDRYLQLSSTKSRHSLGVARQRLIEALKKLGQLDPEAQGFNELYSNYILDFKGKATPERIEARALLEKALEADEDYLPAQLIKAVLSSERPGATAAIKRLAYSGDPLVEGPAFNFLAKHRFRTAHNITPELFAGIVGSERATQLVEQLKREDYLGTTSRKKLTIRARKNRDALLNRPHDLNLRGFTSQEAVQAFELLRQLIYQPGKEIRFITPRRYYMRDLADYRQKWRHHLISPPHRWESTLQQEMGKNLARIDIALLGEKYVPPSIRGWGQDNNAKLRHHRLVLGLDAFASSAFVEPSNLQPLVLLGHTLCLEAIGKCELGRLVNNWVVAYIDSAYPDRRNSYLYTSNKEQDELDGLLFLAASAVDHLAEANLTAYTRQKDYYNEALAASRQRDRQATGGYADRQQRLQVGVYVEEIRNQCGRLQQRRRDMRSLRRVRKYVDAMNSLAELSIKDKRIRKLRTVQLKAIGSECSEAYPYMVLAMDANADFLSREQDAMVWRVLEKKHLPALRSDFLEHSFTLFEKRIDAGRVDIAKRYVKHYERYYGINRDNVIDFAYLYHRLGDDPMARRLLYEHDRAALELSDYVITAINGYYEVARFDDKHRLLYRNRDNPRATVLYRGDRVRYSGLGEKPSKWSLRLKPVGAIKTGKVRYYSGNRNPDHPDRFCFDNGGRIIGDIHWLGDSVVGEVRVGQKGDGSDVSATRSVLPPVTSLEPLTKAELKTGDASMLSLGYVINPSGRFALKANAGGYAAGPIRPSHFPKPLVATMDVNGLIERLFAKGYLSVSGVPNVEPRDRIYEMLEQDFPDLTPPERRMLKEAYSAAGKMGRAGHVEVYHRMGDAWRKKSPLTAADATAQNGFGRAISVSEHHAFVCDYRNGLYVFHREGQKWQQRQRLDVNCRTVEGSDEWVAVQADGKVVIFANEKDGWNHYQVLHPYDHLLREDEGVSFEYFGRALALSGKELFVADARYIGGEISRYHFSEGRWHERERLTSPEGVFWFGKSLLATNGYLAVGMDVRNEQASIPKTTGQLLLYRRQADAWQSTYRLAPIDSDSRDFPKWLWRSNEAKQLLYMKSRKQLFRYPIPHG